MRIQHNIMAMNAYRNYSNNVSAMKKNLERLSSGYKINRAGDDAAGLAISEKMRAQITGLETAQKNAKDGISLVQTAEGALTEVHDMLNRMVELATQSANGTYDNTTDRAQLQKEVNQLRDEINRIADSANFNGIKLLDGSLNAEATTIPGEALIQLGNKVGTAFNVQTTGDKASAATTVLHKDAAGSGRTTFEVSLNGLALNATSANVAVSVQLTVGGTSMTMTAVTQGDKKLDASEMATELVKNYTSGVTINGIKWEVKADGDKLKFTMDEATANALTAGQSASFSGNFAVTVAMGSAATTGALANNGNVVRATTNVVEGSANSGTVLANTTQATGWAAADIEDGMVLQVGKESYIFAISDKVFENATAVANTAQPDGQIYKVVDLRDLNDPASDGNLKTSGDGNSATIAVSNALTKLTEVAKDNEMFSVGLNTDATNPKLTFQEKDTYQGDARLDKLTSQNGDAWYGKALSDQFAVYKAPKFNVTTPTVKNTGKALTLQIGDTAESFNQLKVNVKDMHTASLGISSVDIGDQDNAKLAIDKIKTAINTVSDVRGTLGAMQNRLDHTINNLGVMTENIQDAESTIRDVDVAQEMMAYTKNNILIQSAQAMLAQANQVPQGVLQLLQ